MKALNFIVLLIWTVSGFMGCVGSCLHAAEPIQGFEGHGSNYLIVWIITSVYILLRGLWKIIK